MIRTNWLLVQLLMMGLILSASYTRVLSQTRIVLNGANINISQGAYLVIDNPASDAITRNSGHIISEGENNKIQWRIGTTTGTYIIPWGYGTSTYLPLAFTKTAGTGSGYFSFSTYQTGWQNSTQLPTGIANFNNASGNDKSALAVDRFWQINAQGYTTKPSLSNLLFTYTDSEFSAPNNNSVENGLTAQRWNSTTNTWLDFGPASMVNTTSNTLTISSVANSDLYPWWSVNYIEDRHWIASTPSNWNNPGNWSTTAGGPAGFSIPTSVDVVYFDDVRDASLTLDANVTVNNLVMNPGYTGNFSQGDRTVTINNNAVLSSGTFSGGTGNITVAGDFIVSGANFTSTAGTLDLKKDFNFTSGTFNHNNGSVKFSGVTTQTITGSSTTNFKNIDVTNTSNPGVRVQSNQNLTGTLTLASNSIFDADGISNDKVFTLVSAADDSTQDASIAVIPAGAQVSGNVTVQRYMTKTEGINNRLYRYIASPVQNATVADLQNEIPVTGTFTGASICSGCNTASQSMFAYDESVVTDINYTGVADLNDGFIDFPNNTNIEILQPGKGYAMYVRGNILGSTRWDVRGPITAGNQTPVVFPVTYTTSGVNGDDGWNLVGNPFPSTINWEGSGWTKTNIEESIYIPNNASNNFAVWNGMIGINGGSQYIAMGQAFWVKASSTGAVLKATENAKASGKQTTFFRETAITNLLRITMVSGSVKDETAIHFREGATVGFESNMDSRKMMGGSFNLSSVLTDGTRLAINSQPAFNCSSTIKLAVDNTAAGNYRFDFAELQTFASSVDIVLHDKFAGKSVNVRNGNYSFTVTTNSASYGVNRFELSFSVPSPKDDFTLTTSAVCEGSDASIQIGNVQPTTAYVALQNGIAITTPATGKSTLNLAIPKNKLAAGSNIINIKATVEGCDVGVEKTIEIAVAKKYVVTSVGKGSHCGTGSVTLTAAGAPTNGTYNWYDSPTAASPIADQHQQTFITPELVSSANYYVAIANSLGCEGSRTLVTASIIQSIDAQITASEGILESNYSAGNQWYFNNQLLDGANQQTLEAKKSGIYRVEITQNTCVGSAELQYVVTGLDETNGNSVTVYPNPTAGKVRVTIAEPDNQNPVTLFNSMGQPLEIKSTQLNNGVRVCEFDLTHLPVGYYIIQHQGIGKVSSTRILKN